MTDQEWQAEEDRRNAQVAEEMRAEEAYTETVDALGKAYLPRMLAKLERLAEAFRADGWHTEGAFDLTDDQYSASLVVSEDADSPEPAFDVTITLEESRAYGDDPGGVAFGLGIVEYGGLIVGDIRPYNYTDDEWVPATDTDDVEARWELIDQSPDAETVAYVREHYARKV